MYKIILYNLCDKIVCSWSSTESSMKKDFSDSGPLHILQTSPSFGLPTDIIIDLTLWTGATKVLFHRMLEILEVFFELAQSFHCIIFLGTVQLKEADEIIRGNHGQFVSHNKCHDKS